MLALLVIVAIDMRVSSMAPKIEKPAPYCFIRNIQPAFGKEIFYIAKAKEKLIKPLLKKQRMLLTLIVTYTLKSYHVAFRDLQINAQHIDNKRVNNKAGSFHGPVRINVIHVAIEST